MSLEVFVYRIVAVVLAFVVAAVAVVAGLSSAPSGAGSGAPSTSGVLSFLPWAEGVPSGDVAAAVRERLQLSSTASVDCGDGRLPAESGLVSSCRVVFEDGSYQDVTVTMTGDDRFDVAAPGPRELPAEVLAAEIRERTVAQNIVGDYRIECGSEPVVMVDGVVRPCALLWDGETFGITATMNDRYGFTWSFDPLER